MQKFLLFLATALILAGPAKADEAPLIGVVNFASCVTESKVGKKEQQNMEHMREQMTSMTESTEKELKEIAAKFEDPEYLDSLSPKAEEELKVRFQSLQEDLARYQNQFYQVLNHANYQMVQRISSSIAEAAKAIASEKNFDYVMNKEACFYIRPDLDVTDSIIIEMDRIFEIKEKAASLTNSSLESNTEMSKKAG